MTQEIESIRPALSVILDDGDFVINSIGPVGRAMAQAVLPLAVAAKKVTIITDGEMKVMKRNGKQQTPHTAAEYAEMTRPNPSSIPPKRRTPVDIVATLADTDSDIQEQFSADIEAGRTGEQATGEQPVPTPGPNDPVKVPTRRRPQIFQDAAAPPAPELAEAEMSRLLEEAAQAERESARVQEGQRYQAQQAVQAQADPVEDASVEAPKPRKREPRALATTGRACGRCGGGGQIQGEAGFVGACPVCHGEGQVKTWDRSLKVR